MEFESVLWRASSLMNMYKQATASLNSSILKLCSILCSWSESKFFSNLPELVFTTNESNRSWRKFAKFASFIFSSIARLLSTFNDFEFNSILSRKQLLIFLIFSKINLCYNFMFTNKIVIVAIYYNSPNHVIFYFYKILNPNMYIII